MYKLDKEKRDKLEAEIKSLKDVIEQVKQLLSEKADEMLDINLPEPNLITCHTEQEQKNLQLHGDLSNELTDLQSSLLKYEQVIVAKEQEHDTVIGPHETILNASLKDLKMSTERYFAGDAMTGNKECNAYKSIRENDYTITNCFFNHPEVREKVNDLWGILTNVDSYLAYCSK